MCGIVGLLAPVEGGRVQSPSKVVRRMAGTLHHRGPNAQGFVDYPGVPTGMARLSIVDLATGDPPIANEDESAGAGRTARTVYRRIAWGWRSRPERGPLRAYTATLQPCARSCETRCGVGIRNVSALAEALRHVLLHREEATMVGRRGRAVAVEHFDYRVRGAKLSAFIADLRLRNT